MTSRGGPPGTLRLAAKLRGTAQKPRHALLVANGSERQTSVGRRPPTIRVVESVQAGFDVEDACVHVRDEATFSAALAYMPLQRLLAPSVDAVALETCLAFRVAVGIEVRRPGVQVARTAGGPELIAGRDLLTGPCVSGRILCAASGPAPEYDHQRSPATQPPPHSRGYLVTRRRAVHGWRVSVGVYRNLLRYP